MKNLNQYAHIDTAANAYARSMGYGSATSITVSPDPDAAPMRIGKTIRYGYRKHTTGEYVSNAYRAKFGWKNTYYQSAECEVVLSVYVAERFGYRPRVAA